MINSWTTHDDQFVENLKQAHPRWWSEKRRFIAETAKEVYPNISELRKSSVKKLRNGLFIDTNFSIREMERRIAIACTIAGLVLNKDVIIHLDAKLGGDQKPGDWDHLLSYIRHLLENRKDLELKLQQRGEDTAYFDTLAELYTERKKKVEELNRSQAERKKLSRAIGAERRPPNDEEFDQLRKLDIKEDTLKERIIELVIDISDVALPIPNVPLKDTPTGRTEEFNKLVGEQPPVTKATHGLAHWDIGPKFHLMDMEAGENLSGERFYLLKNQGARLHRALLNWLLDVNTKKFGYSEVLPPLLVKQETMIGSGNLPKFHDNLYHDDETNLWLIPTAEVSLNGIWQGKIIPPGELPLKYVAATPCFRKEHTAAGRDVRGIKRVHQFEKVELFRIEEPAKSNDVLLEMVEQVKMLCGQLNLTYRVLELCTGDIGFQSARTFDIEIWAPGVGDWLEVSSVSTCGDFQARRNNTRYRPTANSEPIVPHTLNGSALALPRVWAAILEAGLRPDQSTIDIPTVLHPYTGFESIQLP